MMDLNLEYSRKIGMPIPENLFTDIELNFIENLNRGLFTGVQITHALRDKNFILLRKMVNQHIINVYDAVGFFV